MVLTTEDSQEGVFLRTVRSVVVGTVGILLENGTEATGDLVVP